MTEDQFKSGEGVIHGEPSKKYIADCLATLSPSWHGELVSVVFLKMRINNAIEAINRLDALKKTLFYGRDNNLIAEGQKDAGELLQNMDCGGANAANIFHAILGKVTETGELLEALKACYNGEVFDKVNAIEEIGDGNWYDSVLLHECGGTFEQAWRLNIAKLKARFPDKFAAHDANNRDLAAERAILENRHAPLADEGVDPEDPRKHHVEVPLVGHVPNEVIKSYIEPTDDYDMLGDGRAVDNEGPLAEPAKPLLKPTEPASGKEAVEHAAVEAAKAFRAVDLAGHNVGKPEPLTEAKPELAKGPAARLHPLPQEKMAQSNNGKKD
jgi:hypothetical protein